MEFISGQFPGNFGTGMLLYSRNVLVLVELRHGVRSCIKIYPFCGNTTRSRVSVFHGHTIDPIVVFEKFAKCIQTSV